MEVIIITGCEQGMDGNGAAAGSEEKAKTIYITVKKADRVVLLMQAPKYNC